MWLNQTESNFRGLSLSSPENVLSKNFLGEVNFLESPVGFVKDCEEGAQKGVFCGKEVKLHADSVM